MRFTHQFQGKKVKVTRAINTDTHRAPYLPNGKAYELQTWYTDGGRRPASATGAMTYKVKGQGRKVTWWDWAVLAQCCTCVISGRRGHTVSDEPGGHLLFRKVFRYHLFLHIYPQSTSASQSSERRETYNVTLPTKLVDIITVQGSSFSCGSLYMLTLNSFVEN